MSRIRQRRVLAVVAARHRAKDRRPAILNKSRRKRPPAAEATAWARRGRASCAGTAAMLAAAIMSAALGPPAVAIAGNAAPTVRPAATSRTAPSTGLVGDWAGTWVREGASVAVRFHFEHGAQGYSGWFDSDPLRAAEIPVTAIRLEDAQAHFEIVGDQTTTLFDGRLGTDTLWGGFVDGSTRGTFEMERAAPRPKPREADVTFDGDSVTLAGTVVLPGASGPAPGVVFVHGSGPEGRWASRYLAFTLAHRGIASLIYDKRGVGGSNGDWKTSGFDALARDAEAAVAFLRRYPGVDSNRVGIHGNSQGGTLAPCIAAQDPGVAFVVASSGSGVSMQDCEVYSIANSLGVRALAQPDSAEAIDYLRELVAVGYDGRPRTRLDSLAAVYQSRKWFLAPPPPDDYWWAFARRTANYDPIACWRRVKVPVLLLWGERDERIPPAVSLERIRAALAAGGNSRVTARIFPGADHTFRIAPASGRFAWPRSVEGYPEVLPNWIERTIER